MNNSTLERSATSIRRSRAIFVKAALEEDDRSARYVAQRIGISHSALGDRLNGKVAFTAEDIERIAIILKLKPVEFYADFLAAIGNEPEEPETSDYKATQVRPIVAIADRPRRREDSRGPRSKAA